MTVSIIICTRNRVESLRLTLASVGRAVVPPGLDAELLVVDNGSTDGTRALVESLSLPNLPVRYLSEPPAGKSHAYNSGLAAARGQIFLFTDDDVRVPANWIQGMCRPILEEKADAVAGGVAFPPDIEAALAQPPFSSHRSWFASTDELDKTAPARMVGANMAFHRRLLDQIPEFEVELGPGALGFHDETLFSCQLLAAGYRLVGAFDVIVQHHFDTRRLTREGMIELARKMGRSHAFFFHHWEHKKSRLAFVRLIFSHLHGRWLAWSERIKGKAATIVSPAALQVAEDLAFYREYLAQRKRRHKYPSSGIDSSAAGKRSYSPVR